MPGQFRPDRPGYAGPYAERWSKLWDSRSRCIATYRRVGDRRADVVRLAPARWRVTITPVCPKRGRWWEPCGPVLELGVFPGRKPGRAAADEYLAAAD